MKPGPPLLALALLCLASGKAGALGGKEQRQTALVLGLVLSGPAAALALPLADRCGNATSGAADLRGDILHYLAALDRDGRVSARCADTGDPARPRWCRLTIGQAPPRSEAVWARTYSFTVGREGEVEAGSVVCATIP